MASLNASFNNLYNFLRLFTWGLALLLSVTACSGQSGPVTTLSGNQMGGATLTGGTSAPQSDPYGGKGRMYVVYEAEVKDQENSQPTGDPKQQEVTVHVTGRVICQKEKSTVGKGCRSGALFRLVDTDQMKFIEKLLVDKDDEAGYFEFTFTTTLASYQGVSQKPSTWEFYLMELVGSRHSDTLLPCTDACCAVTGWSQLGSLGKGEDLDQMTVTTKLPACP